ncbi:non-ribosomal peptide synthase/polyketide synthase [Pendulispora brunnea]|uniref:Non-ribosomal peptide synthase/polyketide synthase n=1 Tax=Pendulispora brunnea TaxID=2905690 RepID=A0ABZ2K8I9_9BACT
MTIPGVPKLQNTSDEFHRLSERYAALPAEKRAAFRARLEENAISPSRLPIVRLASRPGDLPLSHGQERLWFLWKLEPASDAYNVAGAVRLEGELDAAAVHAALEGVVARHEALRTFFDEADGQPHQRVRAQPVFAWGTHDLRGVASAEDELGRILRERARAPFDLARGPLLRAELVRLGDEAHVLLLAVHHIVCDGWSLRILLSEFVEFYGAAREGRASQLPPPAIGYTDFSIWQREWLGEGAIDAQLAYWRERLGGPSTSKLPFDRVENGGAREGAQIVATLTGTRAEAVRTMARARGVTPFMTLLALWASLLSRLGGARDVRIGVPVSGRERRETHGVIGFFVNTLVVRIDVAPGATFASLLEQVRARVLEARANQDVPLSRLESALGDRSAGAKLFDVTFNMEELDERVLSGLPGLTVVPHALEAGDAKFALSLNVTESAGAFRLVFDYSRGAFDVATIEQIAEHYAALLAAVVEQPEANVERVELPCAAEAWGEGLTWEGNVLARVAELARTRTAEPALVHEGRTFSWGELWVWAGRLASKFVELGVGRESTVALCLPRSVELVAGILAVWRAGGAYVPLDPSLPEERLAWQLGDCGARVLVSDATWAPEGIAVVAPDAEGYAAVSMVSPRAEQAAYVIYTSGTTGRPKGVVVSHGALAAYVQSLALRLPAGIASAAYASTPSADLGHTVLFGALFCGFTLHILDEARAMDPDRFAAYMREHRIDALKIVPSHLSALLEASDAQGVVPARCLVLGGETAGAELAARIAALRPACHVMNHYGPTETTVGVLTHDGAETSRPALPLGRPLAHARVYVLDGDGEPSPRGAVGEICIGGESVARGYLGRPGLTAERFVPDARGRAGSRLYRTGDKARHLANGEVEFLGRFDDQVKIRGYRVEPQEIASRLRELPGVRDAAVIARPDARGRMRLLGYVAGEGLGAEAIQRALGAELPAYMVPAVITVLAALPLTANGKIDRAALPEPRDEVVLEERVAPRNEKEEALLDVWQRVLGRRDFGVTDDFFALGGESILTLQVVALARKAGLVFTAKDLFAHPRIDGLAELARAVAEALEARGEVRGAIPLTPIQSRFFERNPEGRDHWNQSVLLGVRGELEAPALEVALRALVVRHDALRLRFARAEGRWTSHVAAEETASLLECVDLRAGGELEVEAQRVQRSLNLERGPLLKAGYFRTGDDEGRLLLAVHHLAIDGVSWRILLDELGEAYEHAVRGELPRTADAPLPWSAWASELAVYAKSDEALDALPYWRAVLGGIDAKLPFGEATDTRVAAGCEIVRQWDEAATQRLLDAAPKAYRMRVDEVLLTALAQTLAAWAERPGALIEVEGHGREDISAGLDPSRTVGWFTTRFPVWIAPPDGPGDALKTVKEALRAVPKKGLSWGVLAYHADEAVQREVRALPRAAVSFNYLGRVDAGMATASRFFLAKESAGDAIDPESTMAHPLDVLAMVTRGALAVHWRYVPGAVDEATVVHLAGDFERRLAELLAHAAVCDVEDVYPATAIQQGLVFHDLLAPGQGVYVNQRRATLARGTDAAALRAAWEAAVARHDILRTQFEWMPSGAMLQAVRRHVALPYTEHDWQNERDYEARLATFRAADLARGFELAEAPLLRVNTFLRPDGALDLVWTNHHAIFDGWSTARLLAEIVRDYRARVTGDGVAFEAPAPFRRFVEWYSTRPSGESWWRSELANTESAGRLTEALGRPDRVEAGIHRHAVSLGGAQSERLRVAARRYKVTLGTMVQGAWALVLGRFGSFRRVVFGVTVAGRPAELPEAANMLGPFINSLPFVADLEPAQSVSAWLGALQRRGSESRQYEHTPLAKIQQWVGRSSAALFDSLLVYENYPVDEVLRRTDTVATVHFEASDRTHYPLTLLIVPKEDAVHLEFAWDGEKIARSRAMALAEHYVEVLSELAADGDRAVGVVAFRSAASSRREAGGPPAGRRRSMTQRIAERVREMAPSEAVSCDGERLTYGQLDALASRIGRALLETGARRGERIGVCVDRSVAVVATCLAIWKVGAAYVPLDPTFPAERLRAMVEAGGIQRVVADPASASRASRALEGTMVVDVECTGDVVDALPFPEVHLEELAYVIFTSGSTGEPKPVGISHRALAVHTADYLAMYGITASDCVYQFATINFDTSVEQIFPTLAAGARLVMRGPGVPDWDALHDVLATERVTALYLPTAYWAQSIVHVLEEPLPALRLLIVAGEEVLPSAVRRWKESPLGAVRLINAYGPTELTVTCTMHETTEADGERATVPIGRAHASRRVYVLDGDGNEVPIYGMGELCVGGDPTARGYLERPGATAERFVPDPRVPGERVYRTGDVCRLLENGVIEFLGRRDHQIKLRGYRIELGEIESALLGCEGVREAAVLLRGMGEARRLIGYVAGHVDEVRLRAELESKLAPYMVPSAIVVLPALPIGGSGKVDRAALPEPALRSATARVAPETELERQLLAIWEAVLARADLGTGDNFFDAGGDSIMSLQIVARARALAIRVTPKQIFEQPTVAELARVATFAASFGTAETYGELPLTPIQAALFQRASEAPSHYNQSVLLRTSGEVSLRALEAALGTLIARHAALRLRFHRRTDGTWTQRVLRVEAMHTPPRVTSVDLRGTPWQARLDEEGERVHRGLDIERGPLLRAAHFSIADGEGRLLLAIHHLAVDGVSWRVLLEELEKAYGAALRGDLAQLPTPSAPWTAWVTALAAHAARDDVRAELAHWIEALAPATTMPALDVDLARGEGQEIAFTLDAEATRALVAAAPRAYRLRIDELLLAALARTLATPGGGLLVDVEGHGREDLGTDLEVSRTVGWFTTAFPLWIEFLEDDHAALVSAKNRVRSVPNKGLHFGLLAHMAGEAERAAVRALPRAQVLFNYLGRFEAGPEGAFTLARESSGQAAAPSLRETHALDVSALIEGGALSVRLRYAAALGEETVRTWSQQLEAHLRRFVEHCATTEPRATAADFPLAGLTDAQIDALGLSAAEDVYPATPAQQGLVFHTLHAGGEGLYVDQFRFTLGGALDVEALRAAFRRVVDRYDVLRTRFEWRHGGEPLQVVERAANLDFDMQLGDAGTDVIALDRAPLMRARLVRRPDGAHDLIWTIHHALLDGWSMSRVLGEVLEAYRSPEAAFTSRVPPFRHYVAWLRRQPSAEAWWRTRIADADAAAGLLTSVRRPSPAIPGSHKLAYRFDAELDARLKECARRWRITLSTLAQAAWALVLSRFGNRDRIVFGATVSGRPADLPGVEQMVGLFINSLPVWVDLRAEEPVIAWLQRLQAHNTELRQYEHTALRDVQQWAKRAGEALFDTLLVYENYPIHEALRQDDGSLDVTAMEKTDRTHYPLTLTLQADPTLRVEWEWDGARIERSLAESLAAAYGQALEQFAGAVHATRVGELVLGEARVQPLPVYRFDAIQKRIARTARANPEAEAIFCEGVVTRYGALETWSNRVGHALAKRGVKRDELVGLCVERSAGLVAGLLGVWKSGGAFVPLDPTYPEERLREMLSGVRVVVCDASTAGRFADAEVVRIDEVEREAADGEWPRPHPEQLAYVIYTSGSTGRPKGVGVSHRSLSLHVDDFVGTYGIGSEDRVLFSSTINFDVSLHELLPVLTRGGRSVMRGKDAWELEQLTTTLREQEVTFARVSTAYWQQWVHRLPEALPKLRQVTVGGEGLAGGALQRWFAGPLSAVKLDNLYGPTETTVASHRYRTQREDGGETIVPIGQAFPGRTSYVMDRWGNAVPAGGVGELCIGGASVARGYLERPGLTAERFVPDPQAVGGRLYRSGDVCRERADGVIEFLGRADAQIKLRGYRIELGEIESALRGCAGVTDAVAEVKGEGESRRLVGYATGAASVEALRAAAEQKLPSYMVPSAYVVLEALPLLPNGKVNRRALPEPELETAEHVAPRTELEATLQTIWQAVLKRESIGVTENFFELGGDSILSLQIIARARESGWKLTPRQVFEQPTIASSARVAQAIQPNTDIEPQQQPVRGPIPLTPIQARFFERHPQGLAHSNQSVLLRVGRELSLEALERALARTIARHDALRLRFTRTGDTWSQHIADSETPFHIDVVDLRNATDALARLDDEGHRLQGSLDLERGPLLRAGYFRLPNDEHRLLLAVHHLAVDGVSWRILLEELELTYAAIAHGDEPSLPRTGTPWSAWAVRLHDYATREDVRSELAWWTEALASAHADLPIAHQGDRSLAAARTLTCELDPDTTRRLLEAAPRAYRMRIDEVLLTALARALGQWTSSAGALVDLEGHGREDVMADVDIGRTVGWFTTRFPVWLETPDEAARALTNVKERLRSIPHKGLHWGLLRHAFDPAIREAAATLPRAQVSFNYLGQFDQALDAAGPFGFASESAGRNVDPRTAMVYALDVNALVAEGTLSVTFRFSPDVLDAATAERLVGTFGTTLRSLIEHCASAPRSATAADFPLARLAQHTLERLELPLGDVQDIYPATPLQQGLLFHSMARSEDGLYVYQLRLTMAGALDVAALRAAWETLVGRYDILRTCFEWRHGGEALQIVHRQVDIPFAEHDWSAARDYAERFAAFCRDDVARGFDVERPPLMRVAVFTRPDGKHDVVWTMHHALSDGWSSARMFGDVIAAYRAHLTGAPAAFAPVVPYRDYVAWLAARPSPEPFWRGALQRLANPARLRPSFGRARTLEPGTHHRFEGLDPALVRALKELARRHAVTLNTVMQGAWAIVLGRYGNATQAIFGTTVSGRPPELPGSMEMVGLFINTLPTWVDLPPNQRIGAWLTELQRHANELRNQEHTPLSHVQRWAGLGGEDFFDTLFTFENFPIDKEARSVDVGLRIERSERADRTHYPFTLTVLAESEVELEWEWDGEKFERAWADDIAQGYIAILQQLASSNDERLGELVLGRARAQEIPNYVFDPIFQRIARTARANPEDEAIHCEGTVTRYGELDSWSNQMAHALTKRGVGRDGLVGLCVERSAALVAGLLGVWKSGGAFVPLDPTYPEERLREMLSGVRVVVCDAATCTRFPDAEVVRVDEVGDEPVDGEWCSPHPEQLAYVIYTSGSTGRPKGVGISHRSLSLHVDDFVATYGIGSSDRVLFTSTINFDVSLHELLPVLTRGGRSVMRGNDPWALETLTTTLRDQGVTFARVSTAYWQQWVHRLPEALPRLRQVTVGGEGLAGDALQRWFSGPLAHVKLDNLYGPTETTVASHRHRTQLEDGGEAIVPIGKGFPGRTTYVLDMQGHPVPRGGIGELCIGGPSVARGYLERPSLTAERFVPDPHGAGGRLYRSGDICRERSDGTLEFLGRADAQIKLRGYRIELGEIEAALRTCEGVTEAVAEVKGEGESRRLVGYVTGAASVEALRAAAEQKLPSYMVPSAFVVLDELPRLPNGKVNRRGLPEPELENSERITPRNDIEATLQSIWQAVLKRESIGVTENFFELGGDSILSLQIIARAREAGWKLTPKQVFEQPTIESAARVAKPIHVRRRREQVVRGEIPLTPIQARFFERHPWGPAHWNQSILLRVAGGLAVPALERALAAIVARHDALRLRFTRQGDTWTQRVADAETNPLLEVVDLQHEADPAPALERACNRIHRSLDLARGPLLRVGYFLLPNEEARLLLTVHHLAVDAVSWRILLEEIEPAYLEAERGEAPSVETSGTPWSVWAVRLAEYARRDDAGERLAWWERMLARAAEAPVPAIGEADRRMGASRAVHWKLGREATEQLVQAAPRAYRMRIDEVLLTALARTLAEWTSGPGALVHLEGHGREDVLDDADIGRTIGWFTTRFPIWLEGEADEARALTSIKESLRSIPDKGIDWGLLAYLGNDDVRARARAQPLPWVSFNYLGRFDEALPAEGRFGFASEAAGEAMTADSELAHLLELNGLLVNGELSMSWRYSPGLLDGATVERLVASFDANVRALTAHCASAEPATTASDFTLARITQAELEAMNLPLARIQDIYPATPLQQGLIFESLLRPSRGAYINQLRLTLRGKLDLVALREAWSSAVARHDILRTHFEWRHGGEALQVVHREAVLPFVEYDWSGEADYDTRLARWREGDLARGFAMDEAPLLRIAVFRRPDGAYDLFRTSHHALSDGWAAQQLFGEILAEYGARSLGEPLMLPVPVPYRHYIAWLQSRPSARVFWEKKFRRVDDPACVSLATQRSSVLGLEPGEPFERHLGAALSQRLRDSAQRHQITLNTLVQGAWALLLARMADRRQALFGATVSGRPPELDGSERILGPFINTLPVVIHMPPDLPVAAWLQGLQREATELRQYEYTPLNELQQWAGRAGDALFDSIIVFENYPIDQELFARDVGVVIEHSELVDRTHYPLTLTVVPNDAEIKLEWSWDPRKVSRSRVLAMADGYTAILEQLACEGERILDEIRPHGVHSRPEAGGPPAGSRRSMDDGALGVARDTLRDMERGMERRRLDGDMERGMERRRLDGDMERGMERRRLGGGTPASGRLAGGGPLLPRQIGERVELQPHAEAVSCDGERLTYAQLDALANRIARKLGSAKGERIGVRVERSVTMVAACLGIWKAGGAYVPLDPSYPEERLRAMVQAGAVHRILAELDLDGISDAPMFTEVHPDELAYVMFTSGSTGEPKAVGITHRALALHTADFLTTYAIDARDTVYQFATINFDTSVEQIFPSLAAGARIVVRGPSVPDWATLHDVLAAERVTVLNLSTAYWAQAIAHMREPLPALRVMLIGGEAVTPDMLQRWQASALGSVRLTNGYGPTEITVTCTVHETTTADAMRAVVPIGRAHASRRIYVLDADGGPVPLYGIGELCVGGDTLARGYLERAGATAAVFVPDPFVPGARVYRTGDICRVLEDGVFEFLGRRDDQIKLRGHRIELGDIESALRRIPGVRDAVAALVPGTPDARLAGYVVGDAPPAAIIVALEAQLPRYMVPSVIMPLDALPLLPNGKLDRRALPRPDDAPPAEAVPPRTALEATLLDLLRDVLQRRDLGVTDDFFAAGGDSLAVLRLAAAARRRAVPHFSMEAMFAARTAEALARHIEAQSSPSNIVALNTSQAPRHLFCVHPLYGIVGAYAPLAASLADVATVHGIQSPIYTDPAWRAASIEELAREYVRRMRLVQPEGPYALLGWSLGGWIAAAMISELERTSIPVAFLAIADTRAVLPAHRTDRSTFARDLERAAITGPSFDTALEVLVHHDDLLARHRIARLQSDVHVWRATRPIHGHDPVEHGPSWQTLTAGTAHTFDLDATHESIVEDAQLVAGLRALLRK